MAFRKVAGSRKYFKYNECTVGQKLVDNGEFLGSEDGKYGIQHLFDEDGTTVVLNSSGHLNWLLKNHVKTGQRVNVEYSGKVRLTKGAMVGKDAHTFDLEVDDTKVTATVPDTVVTSTPYNGTDITL